MGVQLELGDDESGRCSRSDTTVPYSLPRSVASARLTYVGMPPCFVRDMA